MIWVWIILGITISSIGFCRKKIDPIHYIWILLPVDCYGLNIGGATIKLYMLFAFYLLYRARGKVHVKKNEVGVLFLIISAFVVSDLINGLIFSSILQHVYFIIILIEARIYCDLVTEQDLDSIISSILFSVLGYGIVCVFAMVTFYMGIRLPGIVSDTNKLGAMITRYSTMDGVIYVESFRLHGFENDPNSFNLPFLFGFIASLSNILNKKGIKTLNVLVFVLSVLCIFFSGSRSAIYICALLFVITLISVQLLKRDSKVLVVVLLLVCLFGFSAMLIVGDNSLISIVSKFSSQTGRAGLTTKYGRMTIWKENLGIVLKNNPFFGLGSNQVSFYSPVSRACHNTWLEWMCSIGVLQGLIMDIWFFSGFTTALSYNRLTLAKEEKERVTVFQISYLAIILMLFTIDYIANTYLIFTFMLIKTLLRSKPIAG